MIMVVMGGGNIVIVIVAWWEIYLVIISRDGLRHGDLIDNKIVVIITYIFNVNKHVDYWLERKYRIRNYLANSNGVDSNNNLLWWQV